MEIDDFKAMYHSTEESDKQKSKVLLDMAACYREMIECENRLINHRTTWFLTSNGFLFATLGIIMANFKDYPGFLMGASLVLTFLGVVLAWIYRCQILDANNATVDILARWLFFVKDFFGYTIADFNTEHRIPPIIGNAPEGMAKKILTHPIEKVKEEPSFHSLGSVFQSLHKVMIIAWSALCIIIFISIIIQCFQQWEINTRQQLSVVVPTQSGKVAINVTQVPSSGGAIEKKTWIVESTDVLPREAREEVQLLFGQ